MSSEERNVNMLFKVMDLGLKSISTVESVIGDVLKYLNRDPDARLLKNELDSELKYLDSILSINNEDIREILLKNIGSDICD